MLEPIWLRSVCVCVCGGLACALGGVARPFARSPLPPDRPKTCQNQRKTTKIDLVLRTTLARSPVAESEPGCCLTLALKSMVIDTGQSVPPSICAFVQARGDSMATSFRKKR